MKDSTKNVLVTVLKYLAAIIAGILGTLGATSCGVTRASIYSPKEGTTTSISITTNNPTSVTVDPNTTVNWK